MRKSALTGWSERERPSLVLNRLGGQVPCGTTFWGMTRRERIGDVASRARPDARLRSDATLPNAPAIRAVGPAAVLRLQRAAGNAAVQALLHQPRSSAAPPDTDVATAGEATAVVKVPLTSARRSIQRTLFKYAGGAWTIQGVKTPTEPFGSPDQIAWPWKVSEDDTFDNVTGKGTRMVRNKREPFDLMDRVGGDRGNYGGWFEQRRDTAYTHTTADPKTGGWGPHTVAHITKRAVVESSGLMNKEFAPTKIKERTGLLPSAGQNRRLIREHEERTGVPIPDDRKRSLDKAYKRKLRARSRAITETNPRKRKRLENEANEATADAIELSMFSTYSHGTKSSAKDIAGKGEKREKSARDVRKLIVMEKEDPLPDLETFDPGGSKGFRKKHRRKYLRDLGRMAAGYDSDISEFELSSDDEYDEPDDTAEPPAKKRKTTGSDLSPVVEADVDMLGEADATV